MFGTLALAIGDAVTSIRAPSPRPGNSQALAMVAVLE
jgi:hypothetical protein